MNRPRKYTILTFTNVIILFLYTNAFAQLTVTQQGAQSLVNNVLLGNGITSSNISFDGASMQLGYFNASNSSLGINEGIVLCTEDIVTLQPGVLWGNSPGNANNDQDLLELANSVPPLIGQTFEVSVTNDVAILEFDFTAVSDEIQFRYVFASQEYDGYENTTFNDVFAFFISGPGISGPYASPSGFPNGSQNIAVVPGSNPGLPITISSVNSTLNSSYYIDNEPSSSNIGSVEGFTTPFTATAEVQCGETYHIKLAIADGTDFSLISAIFLEAGSFEATGFQLNSQIIADQTPLVPNNEDILFEGCTHAEIVFTRTGNINEPANINYVLGGSAENNVDYYGLPGYINFIAGQDTIVQTIISIADNISEPLETVIITIPSTELPCGSNGDDIVIELFLKETPVPQVYLEDDTVICSNQQHPIIAEIDGGYGLYYVQWSNGESSWIDAVQAYDTIWVDPITSEFTVSVYNDCQIPSIGDTASMQLHVPSFNIDLHVHDTIGCLNGDLFIDANVEGGIPPFSYWWENSSSSGNGNLISINAPSAYTMYVTDFCQNDTDFTTFFVDTYGPIQLENLPDLFHNCPLEKLEVTVQASGGSGNFIYSWDNWQTLQATLIDKPYSTTSYTVVATDNCNQFYDSTSFTAIVADYDPIILDYEKNIIGCKGDEKLAEVNVSGGRGTYTFSWPSIPFYDSNYAYITLKKDALLRMNVQDECLLTKSATFNIDVKKPLANFDATYWDLNEVTFTNLSSNDAILFWWDLGDGYTTTEKEFSYAYADLSKYKPLLVAEDVYGCKDTAQKEIVPPDILWTPNSFSPNNDGLNDVWIPIHSGILDFKLEIFNRWGDLIYVTSNEHEGWDGTKNGKVVQSGTYHALVSGKSVISNKEIKRNSTVFLIR